MGVTELGWLGGSNVGGISQRWVIHCFRTQAAVKCVQRKYLKQTQLTNSFLALRNVMVLN